MGARNLARMGLDRHLVTIMGARGICIAKDLLERSELDLMMLLDWPLEVVQETMLAVSTSIAPSCSNALQMLNDRTVGTRNSHLPTHLSTLDEALYGGIPLGAVTELVGPAGVGKTQLCLMLSIFATLEGTYGGLGGSVVYMDTENRFSSLRLVEMAQTRFPQLFATSDTLQQVEGN